MQMYMHGRRTPWHGAVHNGVVNGIQNNQLAPTHTAQRSQVAKIIMEITMLYDLA